MNSEKHLKAGVILLSIGTIFLFTACATYGPTKTEMVEYFIGALNADDDEAIMSFFAADSPLMPLDYSDVREAFPDTDFEIYPTRDFWFNTKTVDGIEYFQLPVISTSFPLNEPCSSYSDLPDCKPGRVYLLDIREERLVGESRPKTVIYRIYDWQIYQEG